MTPIKDKKEKKQKKSIMDRYKVWAKSHTPTWETDNLIGNLIDWEKGYEGLCKAPQAPMTVEEYDTGTFLDKLSDGVFLMEVFDKNNETKDVITVQIIDCQPQNERCRCLKHHLYSDCRGECKHCPIHPCVPSDSNWEEELEACVKQAYQCGKLEHEYWHIDSIIHRLKLFVSKARSSEREKATDVILNMEEDTNYQVWKARQQTLQEIKKKVKKMKVDYNTPGGYTINETLYEVLSLLDEEEKK